MKLTGSLKNKVFKAETMEEKKDIIAKAGMELTNDELENVTGGVSSSQLTVRHKCDKCNKETTFNLFSGGRAICTNCGNKMML